ncbi:hypothetical protein [Actinomadura sp. NBRC 104412]|uniref:hypothetical protein n=1 Tax=Actinomadura sp. NBRC 104412 TaxID=3032203 RepID=UPI002556CD30|nr:hypothetical protein [Actinomadura sp. NBRC 104412]
MNSSDRRARWIRRFAIMAGAVLLLSGVNLALDTDVPLTPSPTDGGRFSGPAGEERPTIGPRPNEG